MTGGNPETVWHIGWPKTATTSLQVLCFPNLETVRYAGKPWASKEIERAILEILYADAAHFDGACLDVIRDFVLSSKKEIVLFSNEGFLMPSANDLGITVARLQQIDPDLKIVLTVRNQIDLLQSSYTAGGYRYGHLMLHNTKVGRGKYLSFEQWLDAHLSMSSEAGSHHKSMISLLDFETIVTYLEGLLGPGRISIVPYELLSVEPDQFAERFSTIFRCDFPRIDDSDPAHFQNLTTRSYNARLPGFYSFCRDVLAHKLSNGVPRYQIEMPSAYKKKLEDRYRAGNSRLERNYDLGLEALGYPL